MAEKPDDCDKTGQFTITTPLGSLMSKGRRSQAELMIGIVIGGILLISYFIWHHHEDTLRDRAENTKRNEMLSHAIKDFASAQREMACIISIPQEKREAEYRSPSGICKRLGAMP